VTRSEPEEILDGGKWTGEEGLINNVELAKEASDEGEELTVITGVVLDEPTSS